ncbi:MAG: hypothetical protein AAF413_02870 [Patescibacteria group bacterium]
MPSRAEADYDPGLDRDIPAIKLVRGVVALPEEFQVAAQTIDAQSGMKSSLEYPYIPIIDRRIFRSILHISGIYQEGRSDEYIDLCEAYCARVGHIPAEVSLAPSREIVKRKGFWAIRFDAEGQVRNDRANVLGDLCELAGLPRKDAAHLYIQLMERKWAYMNITHSEGGSVSTEPIEKALKTVRVKNGAIDFGSIKTEARAEATI